MHDVVKIMVCSCRASSLCFLIDSDKCKSFVKDSKQRVYHFFSYGLSFTMIKYKSLIRV